MSGLCLFPLLFRSSDPASVGTRRARADVRYGRVRARGMTLIEIMVVLVLMALLFGTLIFGSGTLIGANKRAAASLVVTAVRKGLAHANTTGKPVRLRMDLDGERLVLEESSSRSVLRKTGEQAEQEAKKLDAGQELLASVEMAAEAMLSGTSLGGPSFTPFDALGQNGENAGKQLQSGIKIIKVQTEHDDGPIEDGEAFLYFWPGGVTERAIIQLARSGDDTGLTVVVSPLTGRAEVQRGRVELPPQVLDGEDYSERDF
jgi:general secretion pathway protein H